MIIKLSVKAIIALTISLAIAACSGSNNSSAGVILLPGNNISGIAASGTPLSGSTFSITDAATNSVLATGVVDSSGFYQTALNASQAPFVINVTDATVSPAKVYKALVLGTDIGSTMNVTPISDMVTNIALNDPTILSLLSSVKLGVTANTDVSFNQALATARLGAIGAVQTALSPLLAAYGVTDTGLGLLTHTFTPTVDPIDKVLDTFISTCTGTQCSITLTSAAATAALGKAVLAIPTSSVADANSAAVIFASVLTTPNVLPSIKKIAPVVVVLRAVSSWGGATDAWAGYTGSISVYNFTDKDYSGNKVVYFESKNLQAQGFWNASSVASNGKFQLTMPNWAVLPPASAGGATVPFVMGFNGSGTLASALDLTGCNINGDKCILMIDDGSLGPITVATGATTSDVAAASVRSWSIFLKALPPTVLNNASASVSTLKVPTPSSSANNGAATAVAAAATQTATFSAGSSIITRASIGISVSSAWSSGFNGNINLLNSSGVPWTAWSISFDLPSGVSKLGSWGNYVLSQSGTTVTFSNETWNGVLANRSAIGFGFGGTGSLTSAPDNCRLTYVAAGTSVTGACSITASTSTAQAALPTQTTTPTPTPTPSPTSSSVSTPTTNTVNGTAEPTVMINAKIADQTKRVYVGYYPTWSDNWFNSKNDDGSNKVDDALLVASKFARVPAVYTHIVAAFAQPDFSYTAGATSWSGTGIGFTSSPQDIKAAIAILHSRNIKVLLAVGGATYNNWGPLASEGNGTAGPITASLTAILTDLGFDGLDVDYEISGNNSIINTNYAGAVKAMSNAVKAAGVSKILAVAAWSTGADCVTGGGKDVACNGVISYWGDSAGRERAVFADVTLAAKVDMVNVMSYDAHTDNYDGVKAWQLYRNLFPSKTIVSIGLETAAEGWAGGNLMVKSADASTSCAGTVTTLDQFSNPVNTAYSVERYINHTGIVTSNSNTRDGAMLWQILKSGVGACNGIAVASPGTIGAQISTSYGLPADNSRAAWQ